MFTRYGVELESTSTDRRESGDRRAAVTLALPFQLSGLSFRLGLLLVTFEEIRPFGILCADYFFACSFLLILCSPQRRLLLSKGSGLLTASAVIVAGAAVSGLTTGPALRVLILFGVFAPLCLAHSKGFWRHMRYLLAGITINCAIAVVAAWVWPGVISALSVDPRVPDFGQDMGRFGGLTGHPNALGIVAALGVLVALGLLVSGQERCRREIVYLQIVVCVCAAVLSGSRTFFVALAPPLLIFVNWKVNFNKAVRTAVCIAVVSAALWFGTAWLFPSASASYTSRLGKTSENYVPNRDRIITASLALVEIAERPISGWGLAHFGEAGMAYIPAEGDFLPAHVVFLHYWYAEGILGALGFALLFALPILNIVKRLKGSCPPDLRKALRLGLGIYVLLFIASNLHPLLLNRFLFMPLFMVAGLTTLPWQLGRVRKSPTRYCE